MNLNNERMTIDLLIEMFSADARTGEITWRKSPGIGIKAGQVAGSMNRHGYRTMTYGGVYLLAHRVVWALSHGAWPDGPLDHINGTRDDNRLSNLRVCTTSQNCANRRGVEKKNRHGTKGITPLPHGRWQAQIVANGKYKYLGSFTTQEGASNAYNKAALAAFGDFAQFSEVKA